MYPPTKNELCVSRLSKVIILQTVILTDATENTTSCVVISRFVVSIVVVLNAVSWRMQFWSWTSSTYHQPLTAESRGHQHQQQRERVKLMRSLTSMSHDRCSGSPASTDSTLHGLERTRPSGSMLSEMSAGTSSTRFCVVVFHVCSQLPEKTYLRNNRLCMEWDIKFYSASVSGDLEWVLASPENNQSVNQREICRAPLYDTSRSANNSWW